MSVSLTAPVASPAPLGTVVPWTATALNANPGTLWYRFRTRSLTRTLRRLPDLSDYGTVVDYGPNSSFSWSTIEQEGTYEIEATVANEDTGEKAATSVSFTLTPLVRGSEPAVTPTTHPLVFIYSAPPCPAGSSMSVQFQSPDGTVQNTPGQACSPAFSMNFFLAGLRANTLYTAQHTIIGFGSTVSGPQVSFTTGTLGINPVTPTVITPPPVPTTNRILLQSLLETNAIASDLTAWV